MKTKTSDTHPLYVTQIDDSLPGTVSPLRWANTAPAPTPASSGRSALAGDGSCSGAGFTVRPGTT